MPVTPEAAAATSSDTTSDTDTSTETDTTTDTDKKPIHVTLGWLWSRCLKSP